MQCLVKQMHGCTHMSNKQTDKDTRPKTQRLHMCTLKSQAMKMSFMYSYRSLSAKMKPTLSPTPLSYECVWLFLRHFKSLNYEKEVA